MCKTCFCCCRLSAKSIIIFFAVAVFPPSILLASGQIPEITNDNAFAKAFFWLKKTDGTTEIISIPPQSKKALPVNTVEIQYLYMEGKGSKSVIPDVSTLELLPPAFPLEKDEAAMTVDENLLVLTSTPGPSLKEEARRIDERYAREVEHKRTPAPAVRPAENPSKIRRFFEENW